MTITAGKPHRDTLYVEDAEILSHDAHAGDQFILRVRSPECAEHALPGSFAHLRCADALPMRRPLSIMRTDPRQGTVDFLYKAVGTGTSHDLGIFEALSGTGSAAAQATSASASGSASRRRPSIASTSSGVGGKPIRSSERRRINV